MAARPGMFRSLQLAALAGALIGCPLGARSAAPAPTSYSADEVEAAFLYRFASFVSWPRGALAPAVFTVAVLDDDALASDLERMLPHDQVQGRRVQVRRITSIDQLGDAQILYIGESDERMLRRWLAQLAGRPLLTVTSQPGGLQDGSTINFLLVDRHVRFEISIPAARRSGLTISADLLSVATRVEGRPLGSEPPCGILPAAFGAGPSCAPWLAAR